MSPSIDHGQETATMGPTNLYIHGLGVEYPPHTITADALDTLARRHYPSSPALEKVLMINQFTGIETRSSIGNIDHEIANGEAPPSIAELCDVFLDEGVKLSVEACKKAIADWGGDPKSITHVVATTCTNSANPGFDHYVVKALGMDTSIEKVLLHGVGCSGGLNALRTAANIALGSSFRRKPARVLVLACELSTPLVRSELESIHKNEEVRIGVTLFSDCASAVVLGNGVGMRGFEENRLELLSWDHKIIDDTEKELGFDVDPQGWKVVLTMEVPKMTAVAVKPIFERLVNTTPDLLNSEKSSPLDFDWALHPGGSTIITGVEQAMGITQDHLRASYQVYMSHGNSSSATFFSVLDQLLKMGPGREHIFGCAFGPGIAVETMVFKRLDNETDSSGNSSPGPAADTP